jgi:hypothetical protein
MGKPTVLRPEHPEPIDPASAIRPCVGHLLRAVVLTCVLGASTGCAKWQFIDRLPFRNDDEPAVPDQIVPMWTDTVMYQPGKPGVRGFGARIYFYQRDANTPMQVDGSLIVYAFDANDLSRMPVPERKFIFTADQLAKHHSKTSLGDSYSIWIPWDEVGGPSRQLSLVTRFEGRSGGSVVSEPARKLLSGIGTADGLAADGSPKGPHVAVSYDDASAATSDSKPDAMPAIAIDVPPSFSRKLRRGPDGTVRPIPNADEPTQGRRIDGSTATPADGDPASARADQDRAEEEAEAAAGELLPYRDRLAAHFAQRKYPARNSARSRPTGEPLRREPHRGAWLSGLPPTPRSNRQADSDAE